MNNQYYRRKHYKFFILNELLLDSDNCNLINYDKDYRHLCFDICVKKVE